MGFVRAFVLFLVCFKVWCGNFCRTIYRFRELLHKMDLIITSTYFLLFKLRFCFYWWVVFVFDKGQKGKRNKRCWVLFSTIFFIGLSITIITVWDLGISSLIHVLVTKLWGHFRELTVVKLCLKNNNPLSIF